MAGRRVHFVMPDELVDRIDAALAEGQSRGEFVRRAVEQALDRTGVAAERAVKSPVVPPAPAEQPVHEFVPASTHNALVEAAEQISEEEARQLKAATQFYPAPSSPYPPVVSVRGRAHAPTCRCPVCSS